MYIHVLSCVICGEELFDSEFLCPLCEQKIEALVRAQKIERSGFYVYSAFTYEDEVRELIRQMKYGDKPFIAQYFAQWIYCVMLRNAMVCEQVSYVPMFWFKRWRRGYDVAALLATELAELVHVPCKRYVQRARWTQSLYSKNRTQRRQIMKGAFQALKQTDQRLLVIDDVLSSASSIDEVASVLLPKCPNLSFFVLAT